MSGPKVVRIVTREEVEAICRRHFAAVEAASEALRRTARQLGVLDENLEHALQSRLQQLRNLLATDRFLDVQKQAPEAVTFLRADGVRLQEQAVAAAAAARSRARQAASAAQSVAVALDQAGLPVPAELRAPSSDLAALERHIATAARQLTSVSRDRLSPEAQALASRLQAGEQAQTVAEWLTRNSAQPPSPAEVRLDRLLSEISVVKDKSAAQFEHRAAEIAQEKESSRRSLLTDSLILDVSAHMTKLRMTEELRRRLGQTVAALSQSASKEAHALRARVEAGLASTSRASVEALEAEANALIAAEDKAFAAAARRRSILNGFAELGYELGNEIEHTWLREGRVVIRRPGTSDYGVELGSPADASRMQVRLVGSDQPSTPRNPRRDTDQETIWCTDFDRLKAQLAESGSQIVLERALEPGTQPVKAVTMPRAVVEASEASIRPLTRATRP